MTDEIVPATPDRLDDLAELFGSSAAANRCWCMNFILPRRELMDGLGRANQLRFEAMARTAEPPMGLLAYRDGRPIGWCAAGPRSRYPRGISPRATILKDRDPGEDDDVWLVPCFFVRRGERHQGTTYDLLTAVVDFARARGAKAIEGWPLTGKSSPDEYVGREQVFLACGFECIRRPTARRAVMRLDLAGPGR
jgi:GNAT superfamily N-acetyltransferase